MSEETIHQPPASKPSRARTVVPILGGFIAGAAFWVPPFAIKNESALAWLIIVPFAEPPVAVVLAVIPATRKFGLGVLLAAGLGWLALGAMCSGMLR